MRQPFRVTRLMGELHFETAASPTEAVTDAHGAAQACRRGLHDRQAESGARHLVMVPTIESLEYPGAIGDRDSDPVIVHPQTPALLIGLQSDHNAAAIVAIAKCVLDEIGNDRAQCMNFNRCVEGIRCLERQFNVFGHRRRSCSCQVILDKRYDIAQRHVAAPGNIQTREDQQLLDQMRGK